MARFRDRNKLGKENSIVSGAKDESDAATLRSGYLSLKMERSDRGEHQQRSQEPSLRQPAGPGVEVQTVMPVHLVTDPGSRGQAELDSRKSVIELLRALDAKISDLTKKSGCDNSDDEESVEIHSEMQKLLEATMRQKEDFNKLLDTVKRQKQILKNVERLAKNGKLTSAILFTDMPISSPVQCSQDLEELTDRHDDPSIVFLIHGSHEFRRKMSQCSIGDDPLNSVSIPTAVNRGNRILAGQQDYPHMLLQSSAIDALVDSKMALVPSRSPEGQLRGAEGATNDLSLCQVCPICQLTFPKDETDALLAHVDLHLDS